jgi:hypothetical protein
VRQIQRRHRERRQEVWHEARAGLLAGVVLGGISFAIHNATTPCSGIVCFPNGVAAVGGGVVGGAVGLGVGALVGAVSRPRWDEAIPIPNAEARMSLMPVQRGVGVQLRLRF